MKWWDWMPWSLFFECWALSPLFSLSSFTLIKKLFSSSSLSAIRVVSSAYLRLLIFLLAILIPACASSSRTFCMIYSAYKLKAIHTGIFPFWFSSSTYIQKSLACSENTLFPSSSLASMDKIDQIYNLSIFFPFSPNETFNTNLSSEVNDCSSLKLI